MTAEDAHRIPRLISIKDQVLMGAASRMGWGDSVKNLDREETDAAGEGSNPGYEEGSEDADFLATLAWDFPDEGNGKCDHNHIGDDGEDAGSCANWSVKDSIVQI